jgi:hypothetical protein
VRFSISGLIAFGLHFAGGPDMIGIICLTNPGKASSGAPPSRRPASLCSRFDAIDEFLCAA